MVKAEDEENSVDQDNNGEEEVVKVDPEEEYSPEHIDREEFIEMTDIDLIHGDKNQKLNDLMNIVSEICPYTIWNSKYMNFLKADLSKRFKCRIYIISGQNISAQNNVIDFKSMLAGMNALCTANPFIHVKVGDGIA